MKKIFIIANWKSNKTEREAIGWLQYLSSKMYDLPQNKSIIVCPSFTLLANMKSYILDNKLSISLGAQDISPFGEGQYTGEVNGGQIKEYVDYVIIGHSERRKYFLEDKAMIRKKVLMAKQSGLIPILCIQGESEEISQGAEIVVYEPSFAIGTGNPDTPEDANEVARIVKSKNNNVSVLYGGSVDVSNVKNFTQMNHLDGVLVGLSSLNPQEFLAVINNA